MLCSLVRRARSQAMNSFRGERRTEIFSVCFSSLLWLFDVALMASAALLVVVVATTSSRDYDSSFS